MQAKPYRSMSRALIWLLSLCLLLPMLFYGLYYYRYTHNTMGRRYETQVLGTMSASAQTILSKVRMMDATARSLHNNEHVLSLLARDGRRLTASEDIRITQELYQYMQQVYAHVPDATQVHMDAYALRRNMLLTDDFRQYYRTHIYIQDERKILCDPYDTYVQPTHLQYDHNFINTKLDQYQLVFSLVMPVYDVPDVTDPIARLSIDMPVSVLDEICAPLASQGEAVFIVDDSGYMVYALDEVQMAHPTDDTLILSLVDAARETDGPITEGDAQTLWFCVPISEAPLDWYLVLSAKKSVVYQDVTQLFTQTLWTLSLALLCMLALASMTVLRQVRPLKQLTQYVKAIEDGQLDADLSQYVVYDRNDEIGTLMHNIRQMMHTINHFTIRQYQMELANRTSELKALQAQINPHFINNTLQCIATMALEADNADVYQAIVSLAQMMQYAMETQTDAIAFRQEVDYANRYIQLQTMRFDDADLTLVQDISEAAMRVYLPKMVLQPIVENAFKHGNLLSLPGARLTIRADVRDGWFDLSIADNGSGIAFDRLAEVRAQLAEIREETNHANATTLSRTLLPGARPQLPSVEHSLSRRIKADREDVHISNHIGLANVYMRLLLYFDGECTLDIAPNEDSGTTVHIRAGVADHATEEVRG